MGAIIEPLGLFPDAPCSITMAKAFYHAGGQAVQGRPIEHYDERCSNLCKALYRCASRASAGLFLSRCGRISRHHHVPWSIDGGQKRTGPPEGGPVLTLEGPCLGRAPPITLTHTRLLSEGSPETVNRHPPSGTCYTRNDILGHAQHNLAYCAPMNVDFDELHMAPVDD